MSRLDTTVALVLAGLLLGSSPQGSRPRVFLPVVPGIPDFGNAYLPTVSVLSWTESREPKLRHCSGALVNSRLVVTAAHCVCAPRPHGPEEKLPSGMPIEVATGATLADSASLDGGTVTEIWDERSSCSKEAVVFTLVYNKPGDSPPFNIEEYRGKVSVHTDFLLAFADKEGQPWAVWNIADLAVIFLEKPVPFQALSLPDSEVKLGTAMGMAGFGSRKTEEFDDLGSRRFGENTVTKLVKLPKGNVLIGVTDQPSSDGGVPAHTRYGDSGGPCVRKDDPNILVGIVTMYIQPATGSEISYFTSAFQYKDWILENARRADLPADAGAGTPGLDAGVNVSGSDAGLSPSPPPVIR